MNLPVWDTADTVDPSMLPVSPAIQDLLRRGAAARIELDQWRAAFGENALQNAQQIMAERQQLRTENSRLRGKLADLGKPVDADHWVSLDGKCEADCPECAAVRPLAVSA